MHFKDQDEWRRVMMIRKATGKKIQVCWMCYHQAQGNMDRALELCSESPNSKEGGRSKPPVMAY